MSLTAFYSCRWPHGEKTLGGLDGYGASGTHSTSLRQVCSP